MFWSFASYFPCDPPSRKPKNPRPYIVPSVPCFPFSVSSIGSLSGGGAKDKGLGFEGYKGVRKGLFRQYM